MENKQNKKDSLTSELKSILKKWMDTEDKIESNIQKALNELETLKY